MKNLLKLLFFFPAFFLHISNADAQMETRTVTDNFIRQLYLFPQEKIHLHIDKHDYLPGERIWIRAYLVDAALHTSSRGSRYVYVDLLDPLQDVVSRIKIRREDDAFRGYITLPEDMAEGDYVIRAYTSYMQNQDQGYWPHVPVYVIDSRSSVIELRPQFEYISSREVKMNVEITNRIISSAGTPETVSVKHNQKPSVSGNIKNGKASFKLSVDPAEKRHVLLMEYGNYRKYIAIPPQEGSYEISFFPEGGNLISGVPNRVAFKSLDDGGRSAEVTGKILDENGSVITDFTTQHEGMGSFDIVPEKGKRYYALTGNKRSAVHRSELPQATEGLGLKIEDAGETFRVSVTASPGMSTDSLYIVMHTRGVPAYMTVWENKDWVGFAKNGFSSGILQILLLDSQGNIHSERLVFCNNGDQTSVDAAIPSHVGTRGLVSAELKVLDREHNPLETGLSVSVADTRVSGAGKNESILSSLLLTSEVRGYIANPDYYFSKTDPVAGTAADLLMLTHGWRRYEIPDVIRGKLADPGNAPLEVGQEISGQTIRLGGKKPAANAQVNIISPDTGYYDSTVSDDDGRFHFRHFEFPDSIRYVVRAITGSGADRIDLILDQDTPPPSKVAVPLPEAAADADDAVNKYIAELGAQVIHLDPISVKTSAVEQTVYSIMADKSYSEDYFKENSVTRITDVLRHVPGFVEIDGWIYSTRASSIHGARMPIAVFIDGVYVEQDEANALSGTPTGAFASPVVTAAAFNTKIDDLVQIENVKDIHAYSKAGSTVFLGMRAANGAVMITTKSGRDFNTKEVFNMKYTRPLSYQRPVEFYSPRYDTQEKINSKIPDRRTTVYWNPLLRSDREGNVSFDFYAADSPATYIMVVEGISHDGKIVRFTRELTVNEN